MMKVGYTIADQPWMKPFVADSTQKNGPLTELGRLLANSSDPRRQPLHESSSISQITFMAIILKLRNKYGISAEDIDEILLLFKMIAPNPNILPGSISEIERHTRGLLVSHKEHLVCVCENFRFNLESECAICNRPKTNSTKYYTIPIGPRLQQLKEVSVLAKLTRINKNRERFVDDLHTSKGWSSFMDEMGKSAIALSYCSDGFNPFHHHITQGSYSIWAQSGLILNLPQHLRTKVSTTLLYGLISGPRAPKRINIYNEVIVDELVQLRRGLPVYDAFSNSMETVPVSVLFLVCDVPGGAKEQNRVQQNAIFSCGHCNLAGLHSPILDKTVYPGGRMFLKPNDPLRADMSFPSGTSESRTIQMRKMESEMIDSRYMDVLEREQRDEGKKHGTLLTRMTQQTGRYGSTQWCRLGLDLHQKNAPVEPMHLLKVVAEHIVKLLNGDEDGPKLRAQERSNNRFVECCPDTVFRIYAREKQSLGQKRKRTGNSDVSGETPSSAEQRVPKDKLPPAPFTLTTEERKLADHRLKGLKVPPNFGDIPETLFTKISCGVKSHTWYKLITSGVLRYCLRGMLGRSQQYSLNNFLHTLEQLFASPIDSVALDKLEEKWHVALCTMERDFPLSLQSYVMHLLHHLPHYVKLYGPPANFWMFSYERVNKTLSQSITNNQHPELSAVKKMEVQWLVAMLDAAGHLKPLQERRKKSSSLHYLHAGQYKPKCRKMERVEHIALKQLYKTKSIEHTDVITYCFAKKQREGHDIVYRGSEIEKEDQREKACIVTCDLAVGRYVGKVRYFFSHAVGERINELAYIDWIGQPGMCVDSQCYLVKPTVTKPCPLMWVSELSTPVIHAWEDNCLWILP